VKWIYQYTSFCKQIANIDELDSVLCMPFTFLKGLKDIMLHDMPFVVPQEI